MKKIFFCFRIWSLMLVGYYLLILSGQITSLLSELVFPPNASLGKIFDPLWFYIVPAAVTIYIFFVFVLSQIGIAVIWLPFSRTRLGQDFKQRMGSSYCADFMAMLYFFVTGQYLENAHRFVHVDYNSESRSLVSCFTDMRPDF